MSCWSMLVWLLSDIWSVSWQQCLLLKCHLLVKKNFTVLITDRYFAFMYKVEKGERKSVSEKEETRMRLTDGQTMLSVCLWLFVVDGTDCVCVCLKEKRLKSGFTVRWWWWWSLWVLHSGSLFLWVLVLSSETGKQRCWWWWSCSRWTNDFAAQFLRR